MSLKFGVGMLTETIINMEGKIEIMGPLKYSDNLITIPIGFSVFILVLFLFICVCVHTDTHIYTHIVAVISTCITCVSTYIYHCYHDSTEGQGQRN